MPRYYFNVFDGRSFPDTEGVELPDPAAAQTLAVEHAGEVLQSDAKRIAPGDDWRMEVSDASGLVLFRLDVSLSTSFALEDVPASPNLGLHRGPRAS